MNYKFDYDGDIASFTFPDEGIKVRVERLIESSRLPLTGEITVTKIDGDGELHLHNGRLGLASTTAKASIAKELKRYDSYDIDWGAVVEIVCVKTKERYRQGDPIEESASCDDKVEPVKWLIEPLIHEDNPTIVFGEKGTAKSLLGLFVAQIARLPWHDNPLGLTAPSESTPVLYLDYERSKQVFDWRNYLIIKGHNLGYVPIYYLRCWQPLPDIINSIQQAKREKGIKLLVIDSLAQAAGGNINEPETAIRYHSALRHLTLPSFTLGQTSKDPLNRNRSVFGSAFFEYYASSVWECKKIQEEGSPELIMSLTHKKYNLSAKHKPLGFKFTFEQKPSDKEATEIHGTKTDLGKTELSTELSIKDQVYNLLLREGKMKSEDIAEAIDKPKGSVETKLYQNKNMFTKIGSEWGAVGLGYDEEG